MSQTEIKTVPMKEKIKALFKEYYNDETMPVVELEEKVLALFDVVGRSEQFLCPNCKSKARMQNGFIWCENDDCGGIYRAK